MNRAILMAVFLLWAFSAIARDIPIRNASSTCAWITIYRPFPAGPPSHRKTRKSMGTAYWIKKGDTHTQHWPDDAWGAEVRAEFMTNEDCKHPVRRDISVFRWKKDGWPREFTLRGNDASNFGIDIK